MSETHKHVWQFRDDGKYECDCGMVQTKRELAYRVQVILERAKFWESVKVKVIGGRGGFRFSSKGNIIEVEGTPEELLWIYDQIVKKEKVEVLK